jgi:hypothetical protein
MDDRIRRDFRLLKTYAAVVTLVLGALSLSAFRRAAQPTKFTEIDVERINVREKDGKLRMVISSRDRSVGPVYKGKRFGYPDGTRGGIIFFNDEETENGGLTFGGETANGRFGASGHLSFDQYNQDQVVVLEYQDQNGRRRMGLAINDRADEDIYGFSARLDTINAMPDGPAKTAAMERLTAPRAGVPPGAQRVYVGRDYGRAAVLNLSDRAGRTRLRLRVDSLGVASMEFLDENGRVTSRLPR